MQDRTKQILNYSAVAIAACGVALALSPGARGTPDSTNYLNAALHVAAGHGYVTSTLDGAGAANLPPLTVFPPGFSLALAALLSLGLDGRSAMALLLGISYVAYALATCLLFRASLPSSFRWSAPILTTALVVQSPVRDSLDMALSDLLGAAAALAVVGLSLGRRCDARRARVLGLLIGVSVWIRWANLYFGVAIALTLALLSVGRTSLRTRLALLLELGGAMALVLVPLWARNLAVSGTLMGPRTAFAGDPVEQLGLALRGVGAWFATAHAALAAWPSLALAHAALGLALGLVAVLAIGRTKDPRTRSLWVIAACYGLLMVLSRSTVLYDPLSDARFWLPVLPICTAAWLRGLATVDWPRRVKLLVTCAWALLLVHATVHATMTLARAASGAHVPTLYFSRSLDDSENLHRALLLHDAGVCELATNDEFALLPRIGTRPLRLVALDTLPELAGHRGTPLCLLLIGAPALPHTLRSPYTDARALLRELAAAGHGTLKHVDGSSELWLTGGVAHADRISRR